MNLWSFIAIMAGTIAFGCSVGAAVVLRIGGAEPSIVATMIAGMVFGVIAFYVPIYIRNRVLGLVSINANDERTPIRLILLYGGAILWILLSGYFANALTRWFLIAV